MTGGLVVLAAGGTGGHLFPAQALAETLVKRGYRVQLMTDERVRDYGKTFPAEKTHVVHSASPSLSDIVGLPKRLWKLFSGYRAAREILKFEKPAAVVGFGGYPSFPPIYAAASLRIPCAVHEQNAVLGRANKMLSKKVNVVVTCAVVLEGLGRVAPSSAVGISTSHQESCDVSHDSYLSKEYYRSCLHEPQSRSGPEQPIASRRRAPSHI